MATTVGFIKAIGVRTDEIFVPNIMAKLEENFSIKTILEKGLTFFAKLEENFNIKGRIKK